MHKCVHNKLMMIMIMTDNSLKRIGYPKDLLVVIVQFHQLLVVLTPLNVGGEAAAGGRCVVH